MTHTPPPDHPRACLIHIRSDMLVHNTRSHTNCPRPYIQPAASAAYRMQISFADNLRSKARGDLEVSTHNYVRPCMPQCHTRSRQTHTTQM
jgi:hypothetical protein